MSALDQRPELALLVMRVIGTWSNIDYHINQIATIILKSEFIVVASMLEALSSTEGRRAAIRAAAKEAMSEEDFSLFEAVMRTTKPSRDRRNEFAHHVWGVSSQLPDAILLADPRRLSRFWAKSRAQSLGIEHEDFSSAFVVYTKADLERDVRDASAADSHVWDLYSMLGGTIEASESRTRLQSLLPSQQDPQPPSN